MITRLKLSTIEQGLPKYRSMLAGNDAYIPGDYDSIATVSVGAGGAANVEFTSIPGTYAHLQIRLIGRSNRASTVDTVKLQCNTDTGSNYTQHEIYGDGTSAAAFAAINQANMEFYRIAGGNAGTSHFGSMIIDILDYANTNKYKTARSLGGVDNNGSGEIYLTSGLWRSTSAITSIKLSPGVGTSFSQYSHFALYGIKGA